MSRDLLQCSEGWPANRKPWPNRKYFACQMASVAFLFICIVCVSVGGKLLHDAVSMESDCFVPVHPFPRNISSNNTDCVQVISRRNSLLYSGYTLCTLGMCFGMAFGVLSVMICCKGCNQLPAETDPWAHFGRTQSERDEDLGTLPAYSDIADQPARSPPTRISPTPRNENASLDF